MIIPKDISEILNEDEKKLLQNKCDNFVVDNTPDIKNNNNYVRNMININDDKFKSIFKKINTIISQYVNGFNFELVESWLNKVDTTTNKNDIYHIDTSFFTFLFYLNDDFEGGEFEYIENKNNKETVLKIKPKKYLSIFSNNKLIHRVLPVSKGVRYSFVLFYNSTLKNNTSLI